MEAALFQTRYSQSQYHKISQSPEVNLLLFEQSSGASLCIILQLQIPRTRSLPTSTFIALPQ